MVKMVRLPGVHEKAHTESCMGFGWEVGLRSEGLFYLLVHLRF